MTIAFLGLGIMGRGMAANLLKKGVGLTVYNRSKEKTLKLVSDGAKYAETPTKAVEDADIVFTMFDKPETVEEVAFGPAGFVQAMKKGALWADCSTVNPSFTNSVNKRSLEAGIRFVDSPVLGSKVPAENGELIFSVGADVNDFKQLEPYFAMMGKRSIHVGEVGKGSAMKIAANVMLAHAITGYCEAIHLGESLGLDYNFLVETFSGLPFSPPILKGKSNKLLNNDETVEFPLELMHKDLHLMSVTAYENEISIKSTNMIKEIFASARANGLGKEDLISVLKEIRG
jgi:3-hydroxyisobutyrate dehydrogenase/glyoxylate/succinic semialdehyde reductase